jgi:hypothetical protein
VSARAPDRALFFPRPAGRPESRADYSSEKFPGWLEITPKVLSDRRRKPKQAAKQLAASTKIGVDSDTTARPLEKQK